MQPLEEITIKRTLHLFSAVLQLVMRVLVKYRALHQNKCLTFKWFFFSSVTCCKEVDSIICSVIKANRSDQMKREPKKRTSRGTNAQITVALCPWLTGTRMRRSQQRSEINLKSRQMSSAFSLVLISGFSYMASQTRWTRVTKHKRCVSAQMKCSSSGYFCFSGRLSTKNS